MSYKEMYRSEERQRERDRDREREREVVINGERCAPGARRGPTSLNGGGGTGGDPIATNLIKSFVDSYHAIL